jgi:hypothetical protein
MQHRRKGFTTFSSRASQARQEKVKDVQEKRSCDTQIQRQRILLMKRCRARGDERQVIA